MKPYQLKTISGLLVFLGLILQNGYGQEVLTLYASPPPLSDSLSDRGLEYVKCSFDIFSEEGLIWSTDSFDKTDSNRYRINIPFPIGDASIVPTFYYESSTKILGLEGETHSQIGPSYPFVQYQFESIPQDQRFYVVEYAIWKRKIGERGMEYPGPINESTLKALLQEIEIIHEDKTESKFSFMEMAFVGICIIREEETDEPSIIYKKFIPNSLQPKEDNRIVFIK